MDNMFLKRYREWGFDVDPSKIDIAQSIRVNTLRTSVDSLSLRLKSRKVKLKRIPFTDHGFWTEAGFALSSTPEYLQGHYYLQEAASQLPVKVLAPKKGESVLDMCAAPGSKTTQIAQMMTNQGNLVALDKNHSRLGPLKSNLERCGVRNSIVYHKDAVHAADLGMEFDRVLLDAPCSGNFATDSDWFAKRSLEGLRENAKLQRSLLSAALSCVMPGGRIVYSTCSLEKEEDEDVVSWALDNLDVRLEDSGLKVGVPGITDDTRDCRRLWPGKDGTQGFFIACLSRRA